MPEFHRLRCDILLNSMVAQAVTTGKIRVIGNREIWRAVIHVEDVSCAFIAALEAPRNLVFNQAFNVGENQNNFSVQEFAKQVTKVVGAKIEYFKQPGREPTSYKIDFAKINNLLAGYFQPKWSVKSIIYQLCRNFKTAKFSLDEINKKFIRLNRLQELSRQSKLDKNLFWVN